MATKKKATEEKAFDCLAVTNVQVYPFRDGARCGKILGLAMVVLNDQLTIRGLRIMDGENGMFVGYPTDPFYKGEDLRSTVFPLTRALREHIENCVLEKYHASVAAAAAG
jgi:stage V sporulation protein G